MRNVIFYEELPFSETNVTIYREIYGYILCRTMTKKNSTCSVFANYGEKWLDFVPSDILSELKKRRGSMYVLSNTDNHC